VPATALLSLFFITVKVLLVKEVASISLSKVAVILVVVATPVPSTPGKVLVTLGLPD
jgi:hypothetical protein